MSRKQEWRRYLGFPARAMVRAEGWVMARRKGCVPFTVPAKEWDALPVCEPPRD